MSRSGLDVTIPGTPRPQGKLKTFAVGKHVVARYPDHVLDQRGAVVAALMAVWGPASPLTEPVRVRATFGFARPKSHYGTGRNAGELKVSAPLLHAQMPDTDKLCRLVLDALTLARVVMDDAQVCLLIGEKRWVPRDVGGWTRVSVDVTG